MQRRASELRLCDSRVAVWPRTHPPIPPLFSASSNRVMPSHSASFTPVGQARDLPLLSPLSDSVRTAYLFTSSHTALTLRLARQGWRTHVMQVRPLPSDQERCENPSLPRSNSTMILFLGWRGEYDILRACICSRDSGRRPGQSLLALEQMELDLLTPLGFGGVDCHPPSGRGGRYTR